MVQLIQFGMYFCDDLGPKKLSWTVTHLLAIMDQNSVQCQATSFNFYLACTFEQLSGENKRAIGRPKVNSLIIDQWTNKLMN